MPGVTTATNAMPRIAESPRITRKATGNPAVPSDGARWSTVALVPCMITLARPVPSDADDSISVASRLTHASDGGRRNYGTHPVIRDRGHQGHASVHYAMGHNRQSPQA